MFEIDYTEILANKKHEIAFTEQNEFVFFWGGRGSGKTKDVVKILLLKCLTQGYFRCVVVLNDANKLRDSIYQEFVDFVNESKLNNYFEFKDSTTKIVCGNGNMFVFRGGKDAQNIKGLADYNYGLFEEVNLLKEDDYDFIISTIRKKGDVKQEIYHTFNPESKGTHYKEHWLYKRHFEGIRNPYEVFRKNQSDKEGNQLNYVFVHSTLDDNKYCPPELKVLYESYEKTNKPKYNIWRWGRWSNKDTEKLFAYKFNYDTHVTNTTLIPDLPLHISFDQNFLPYSTATIWQIDDSGDKVKFYAQDEICLKPPANSSEMICKEILRRYPNYKYLIYGDYSGKNRTQRIQIESFVNHYDMIKNKLAHNILPNGVKLKPNPPRNVRRNITNYMLSGEYFEIIFNEKCIYLIGDFEQGEIDANNCYFKFKKDGIEELGHCIDTFFYLVNGTYEKQTFRNKNIQ